ncbi:glycosyltransferase [Aliarcobacter lanthieri]|uniref:glycosyltransferase n=1 Tax=Aliarcobacter lanthieri TaxID=1355374 RepID=UPI00047A6007|nr:glycosyltransferase [Aliarcobacter lanthieri]QKF58967.1 glycosyltransferase, family 1 [Aliarcobacter lanthieri]
MFLVIPKFLYPKLFKNISKDYSKNIFLLDMNKWSFIRFIYQYGIFFIKNAKPSDHFHYPLNPLFIFHLFNSTSYSISLCHSSDLPSFKSRSGGLFLQRLSMKWAKNIDILNKSLFNIFAHSFPKYISKTSVTPGGTYIRKQDIKQDIKKDKFIFLSRLAYGKGVETFIKLLPQIDSYVKNKYSLAISFYIFGDGILKQFVKEQVDYLKQSGIDINYGGFVTAETVLPNTKCIFSMQDATNYPSRVIAEGLSYGCNVIASDTGDTREFGELKGLFYYSTIDELFRAIDNIIMDEFNINDIIDSAIVRFSSESYINYFYRVFNENNYK